MMGLFNKFVASALDKLRDEIHAQGRLNDRMDSLIHAINRASYESRHSYVQYQGYVRQDEIALRILCALLSKTDGLAHVNEDKLRQVFRAAYEFQQVSADAVSSPEPEWLVKRGGVNLK